LDFSPQATTIGFVGIGNMGQPMAARLHERGFAIKVHDTDVEAAVRFGKHYDVPVASLRHELCRDCDIVILMLPNGQIVSDYLLAERAGDPAPVKWLPPATLVVDMGSSNPMGTRILGERLADAGISLIDAPVSGGVPRARKGTLSIMVGGEEGLVKRLQPVLSAMAHDVKHVGSLGAGHAMKALNNYVSAAGLAAACEAVLIGQQFGIDGQMIVDVLNVSTGKNNSTEHKLAQYVLSATFNSGFSLGLMHKDLRAALDVALDLELRLPMIEAVAKIWDEAEQLLGPKADHTEIARYLTPAPLSAGSPR
jgi:3-hydroxyisobutyrate dehydrogenase